MCSLLSVVSDFKIYSLSLQLMLVPYGDRNVSLYFTIVQFIFSGQVLVMEPTPSFLNLYSQTSIARTPMVRLPWLIRTRFKPLRNSSDSARKQIFREVSYFITKLYVVCTHKNRLDELTQHTIMCRKSKRYPKLSLFAS